MLDENAYASPRDVSNTGKKSFSPLVYAYASAGAVCFYLTTYGPLAHSILDWWANAALVAIVASVVFAVGFSCTKTRTPTAAMLGGGAIGVLSVLINDLLVAWVSDGGSITFSDVVDLIPTLLAASLSASSFGWLGASISKDVNNFHGWWTKKSH